MHVRLLRRRFSGFWRFLSRLAMVAVAVELVLLVFVTSRAEAATPVDAMRVEQQSSYRATRVYSGRTVAGRASELGFRQPGELIQVLVDVGDQVEAGQPLARLDTDTLTAALEQARADVAHAGASLEAARARLDLARQTERRFARLREAGHVSVHDYDRHRLDLQALEAETRVARAGVARARARQAAARIARDDATLLAPFAGVVQARHRDEGSQVNAGEAVLRLVETSRVEAHVGIPETVAARLSPGERYRLQWDEREFEATLSAVLPEVNPTTRTLTAVLELGGAAVPLGTVVELALEQAVPVPGFWVPLSALAEADRGLWGVYVIGGDETIERRLVEVLHAEADRAYVRGTLTEGDQVVKSGVHRIVPGQRVAPAARS